MDTLRYLTDKMVTEEFGEIIDEVVTKYGLAKKMLPLGKSFYGVHEGGRSIRFYDAYCHNRDCINCSRWTLRIDAWGMAIPCYAKNFKIPLLSLSDQDRERNFRIAICNLGRPPEVESILL